jgi:hypothetical protein
MPLLADNTDSCALDAAGEHKDAKDIEWLHSPSDDRQIAPISTELVSPLAQRPVRAGELYPPVSYTPNFALRS